MIQGYYLALGSKAYFYRTSAKKKTAAVVNAFIDVLGSRKNLSSDLIEQCKQDKRTTYDIKYRLSPATIEKKELPTITFYTITGNNFIENFPESDFNDTVLIF